MFFWPGRGWYAAVTGEDGKRVMRKAPKQTERGAEALLRELLAQRRAGELTRGKTTLAEFTEEWLAACKRRNCRAGTLDTYRRKVDTYVLPTLGKRRLDKLTAGQVEKLYDQLDDAGLSVASIRLVHTCLHNLLKLAKRRKLAGHVVTELVDPPKAVKYEARPLTIDEAKLLLRSLADHRHSKGTLMADEGEDLVVIQKTFGHAKASITADLYIGRVPKALQQAADRYADLLDPEAGTAPKSGDGVVS